MSNHRNNKGSGSSRPFTLADWFGLACFILLGLCSAILYIRLMGTGMVADVLLKALVIALVALNVIHLIIQLPRWRNKAPKLVFGILAIAISGGMIYAVSAADTVQNALMNISGKLVEEETTYIFVMDDNEVEEIGDAVDFNFGALSHADETNTTALLEAVNALGDIQKTAYESVPELVDALYDGSVDAIMLNQGYISLLEEMENYATFSQDTRVLYEFTTTREVEPIEPNPAITREPFVVYCSGIDSRYGDVSIKSLSDVNILAVVNPKTHQVILLNTPRDYYVPLVSEPYTGELDKLTHAGALGIDESMRVLSQLYGVEASYYIRVNFHGLIDIVNALGGVDVVSPASFSTNPAEIVAGGPLKSYYFTEGLNHMSGEEALAFCRERYAFGDGDNQRGKNQMAVIKGIVDKAVSPQILSSYDEVLTAVQDCFITNMPYEDISALVQMQLKDMSGWNITTYAVSGLGDIMPCATHGYQNLWVMWPNEDMVNTAKGLIAQLMNGETPTLPG